MIFHKQNAEELLALQRAEEFSRARASHLRAESVLSTAIRVADEAHEEYEQAKKGLRRVAES